MEDAYAYYVLVLGLPEATFWEADVSFVADVCADKAAWDAWETGEQRHLDELAQKRSRPRPRRSPVVR